MRGLKHNTNHINNNDHSRIFYRCVDWNINNKERVYFLSRRIFYRCVDWNAGCFEMWWYTGSRIFYRCVDWNSILGLGLSQLNVASFTDAWIETGTPYDGRYVLKSHLLQMRGLKRHIPRPVNPIRCRIFYRCVDWNVYAILIGLKNRRRIFYRCVDWNTLFSSIFTAGKVASFTDAWIETVRTDRGRALYASHLLQMRGLKLPE